MKELSLKEMKNVDGGVWITLGKIVVGFFGATFVSGLIDGFLRPLKCR